MAKVTTPQEEWNEAVAKATDAIQILIDMQDDCQAKYDELTEKQQEGEKGLAFSKVTDLDLQGAMDTLNDAADIEIP